MKHEWHRYKGDTYYSCMNCGMIQTKENKDSLECKGRVGVSVRQNTALTTKSSTNPKGYSKVIVHLERDLANEVYCRTSSLYGVLSTDVLEEATCQTCLRVYNQERG